jgi:adenosylmethionine-8-amino-7-oxononanoate aminotransferase
MDDAQHPSTADQDGQYFWHPSGHPSPEVVPIQRAIDHAEGVHIFTEDGTRLLDATSGLLSVVTLGYSQTSIKQAITDQLEKLPYFSAFRGNTNRQAERAAKKLIEEWFGQEGMTRVFFCSGGSDAVETALRLSRQYWKILGQKDRYKFIALKNGYHGSHFGGASINSRPNHRRNYEPLLQGCFHIPTPWTYRNPFDEQDPIRLGEICARLLEEEIVFQCPDTVAAFILEPVTAAGGMHVPPPNFWPRVREICDKYGVLLIADEVICGFGRMGEPCGSRMWGVKPDMMTTAKGITSGYFPLGATLINGRISEAFEKNKDAAGSIGHGYTYSGHPVGCAAACAALDVARDLRVWENAKSRGDQLLEGLQRLQQKHSIIGNVQAKGLMARLELVADRQTKKSIDDKTMERIVQATAEAGVFVRAGGGSLGLSPPLIVDEAHIDQIIDAVDTGLRKC